MQGPYWNFLLTFIYNDQLNFHFGRPHLDSGARKVVKPMVLQQFWRDLHLASACKPKIVRVHTLGGIVFLLWSNEISTFLICRLIRAPCLSGCMLWVRFSESRVFCIGLMKYQQFWFFDGFVRCIGRPFDQHFWALLNHKQIENVEIAQGFSYFLNTRSNHSEWMLLPIGHSWAFRNHRQIENFQNYTRFFIFVLNRIEWILRTWENFQALWKHRQIEKCQYFIRPMQKKPFLRK